MNPEIIYEDEALLVLSKPAGWITNSASTTTTQPVVQDWLKANFTYPIAQNDEYRSGVVHRLDKETSGILLIAKTITAFEELQRQFKERIIHKVYLALAHGEIDPKEGDIVAAVGRLPWRRDRFGVLQGGREAETHYKVINIYTEDRDKFSLVELYPKTGRTHQIRIHLKYIQHPIVADNFYAGRKTSRHDRKWCPRLFLHASGIEFLHPSDQRKMEISCNLPADLAGVIEKLSHS